ncbi:unnamed protein product [Absidia cylindrospora]
MTSYYHTGNKLTLSQVVTQPIVPISFTLSLLGLGFYFYFCLRTGLAKNEKQISWLLTFASSVVCTAVSFPYYIRFWRSGWDMQLLGMESSVHTSLVCFFITYLVMDLSLGSMYYKGRITIATGWIHHSIYIVILFWLMRSRSASFFTVNAILELPTVILAVGSMRASWRSDFLFASSFFALRLVYHAWMIVSVKQYHRLESLWLVALLVFPLHVYWFYGIAQLQVRRFKAYTSSLSSSPSLSPAIKQIVPKGTIDDDVIQFSIKASGSKLSESESSSEDETSPASKAAALAAYQHQKLGKTMRTHGLRRSKQSFFEKAYAI